MGVGFVFVYEDKIRLCAYACACVRVRGRRFWVIFGERERRDDDYYCISRGRWAGVGGWRLGGLVRFGVLVDLAIGFECLFGGFVVDFNVGFRLGDDVVRKGFGVVGG